MRRSIGVDLLIVVVLLYPCDKRISTLFWEAMQAPAVSVQSHRKLVSNNIESNKRDRRRGRKKGKQRTTEHEGKIKSRWIIIRN